MKINSALLIRMIPALLPLLLLTGCDMNKPPEFTSFSPGDGYTIEKGEVVDFYVEATDPDGTVEKLVLEINGKTVKTVDGSYLSYYWDTENEQVGVHEATATATDDLGKEATKTINIIVDPILLAAPTNLHVGEYREMLSISWNTVEKAKHYTIFWTDDGSEPGETSNKLSNIDVTIYNHESLDFTKTYKYRVQAVSGEFTGPLSSTVSGTPMIGLLDVPANVTAGVVDGKIRVSWDPVDFEGVVYTVRRRSPASEFYYRTVAEEISGTTFTDENIEAGKGYFYKVYAVDNTHGRSSADSDATYAATRRTIWETERNNANVSTTLTYNTHYYNAERVTEELDWFRLRGGYSGAYSIYSSGWYRSFDADCFRIYLEGGERIEFNMISGDMSGMYSMMVRVVEFGKSSTGSDREVVCHDFTSTSGSFTYNKSQFGTVTGAYVNVFMWEDLINYGPYNYEVEIRIIRNP